MTEWNFSLVATVHTYAFVYLRFCSAGTVYIGSTSHCNCIVSTMASEDEGAVESKFVCPVANLPTQVQTEIDALSISLEPCDSEPVRTLLLEQFTSYMASVDDVVKDVVTDGQLRTAWEPKHIVDLMTKYVVTKKTATALCICVSFT